MRATWRDKIDDALVARGDGEDADIGCAPDGFKGAGFACFPVDPNLVGKIALPMSAPECGWVAAVRHLSAVPFVNESTVAGRSQSESAKRRSGRRVYSTPSTVTESVRAFGSRAEGDV